MLPSQGIVIACGPFGAQVAAHLETRGLMGLRLLVCNGPTPTRQAGADLWRRRRQTAEGGPVYLVAAADEAAGGGALVAALADLSPQGPCMVWLALPVGQSDRAAGARACDTLLELAALQQSGLSFAGRVHEQCCDQAELAGRVGDALLYHSRRQVDAHLEGSDWRGVGIGVIRDPGATLRRRLARQVAVRVVEQYLRSPDPAHLLPGLKEALHRPMRPLLAAVTLCPVYEQRWSLVTGGAGGLESLVDYYEPRGEWHQQAWRFWDRLVADARKGLASAMGYAWRSGFEVVYAEAQAALASAHSVLETEITRCERSVAEHQELFEAAQEAAQEAPGREAMPLADLDHLVASYLLESMRLRALERLALAMDGVLELVMDGLRAKADQVRDLLRAVREQREVPLPVARLAHALAMVPSAEQEQEWLAELQPRQARALLYGAELPAVEVLLDAARSDVNRYIRSSSPALYLPKGHRVRQAWLERTVPSVTLGGPDRLEWLCSVSPGLPAEYREELATRALAVREESVQWFPGEWVVYAETTPFPLGRLQGMEQALAAVRCLLLGLVIPDDMGLLVLRVAVAGWAPGHPVGRLSDLLTALAAGGSPAGDLAGMAEEHVRHLSPPLLAGYHALLRWFQTAVLDGDRGELDQALLVRLHEAVEVERRGVRQRLMAAGADWLARAEGLTGVLGTPDDSFSLPAGSWRYLRI